MCVDARDAANMIRAFHLSKTVTCLMVLWGIVLGAGACSPKEPTISSAEAYLTVKQPTAELIRESGMQSIETGWYVPVRTGDQIWVDETGRALLSFQDGLLVELFRDSAGVVVFNARLEPAEGVVVRLAQAWG